MVYKATIAHGVLYRSIWVFQLIDPSCTEMRNLMANLEASNMASGGSHDSMIQSLNCGLAMKFLISYEKDLFNQH